MQKQTKMKCCQCESIQNITEYDQENGICQKCYQMQTQLITQFKAARVNTFPQIDMIEEGLYLGNQDAATSYEIIQQNHITAICVCGKHLQTPFQKDPKIIYKQYHINDYVKQKIINYFQEHYTWMKQMREEKRNILIHCAAGVSRSASFMIAFIMKDQNLPFHKALEKVKSRRKWINPNSGFRKQLIQYNKHLGHPPPPQQYNTFY